LSLLQEEASNFLTELSDNFLKNSTKKPSQHRLLRGLYKQIKRISRVVSNPIHCVEGCSQPD